MVHRGAVLKYEMVKMEQFKNISISWYIKICTLVYIPAKYV